MRTLAAIVVAGLLYSAAGFADVRLSKFEVKGAPHVLVYNSTVSALTQKQKLIDDKEWQSLVKAAKLPSDSCVTTACLTALQGTKVYFLVQATTTVTGEIYESVFTVYGVDSTQSSEAKSVSCELCTADEAGARLGGEIDAAIRAQAAVKVKPAAPAMGQVHVDSTPRGATLVLDGKEAGITPLKIKIAPGRHEIILKKPGFENMVKNIQQPENPSDSVFAMHFALVPMGSAPVPVRSVAAEPDHNRHDLIEWGLVGAGVVTAVSGGILIGLNETPGPQCDSKSQVQCLEVYDTIVPGVALVTVGAVMAGTAYVLHRFWDPAHATASSAYGVQPQGFYWKF